MSGGSSGGATNGAMELPSRVAVITGAGSGIGAAMVARLAADGATVVAADIDLDAATAVADANGATAVRLDVTDRGGWTSVLDQVEADHGGIDLLAANAGIMSRPPDAPIDDDILDWTERWEAVRAVNLDGVVWGIAEVVPRLARSGGGDIVVTASVSGLVPTPIDPYYTATKHAVVGLVRSLAPGLEGRGVRINALCPGAIDTAIVPEALRGGALELMDASEMADALVTIVDSGRTGAAWAAHRPGAAPVVVEPPGLA